MEDEGGISASLLLSHGVRDALYTVSQHPGKDCVPVVTTFQHIFCDFPSFSVSLSHFVICGSRNHFLNKVPVLSPWLMYHFEELKLKQLFVVIGKYPPHVPPNVYDRHVYPSWLFPMVSRTGHRVDQCWKVG